tara:strand:- start:453 stop:2372 length:1920 start_codon:yes stop_codon:yes gene_type:complete
MKNINLIVLFALLIFSPTYGQTYTAGFNSLQLKDSSRVYKTDTKLTDSLHYRPVDLDIWYPSIAKKGNPLKFEDLFTLFEQRAVNYQDNEDYTGLTNELAQFYVGELGLGMDGQKLLNITTNSFANLETLTSKQPVVIYMAGFNGMGFENYKLLEKLAQNGYVVISVWSMGRYPGNMTNEKDDMMEQVYDAEFALKYLKRNNFLNANFNNIGIIGYSWGGMSSAVLVNRIPEIKAFVSLDGTETHYFGEAYEDDVFIQEIYDSKLLKPQKHNINYLYLESDNKLDHFKPTKKTDYFKSSGLEKHYVRFKNSTHAEFSSIPSILSTANNSVLTYNGIESLTVSFFKNYLDNIDGFPAVFENILALDYTTNKPYDISEKPEVSSGFSGLIVDIKSNEPLPYINIGILNKETGTVTNNNGEFSLALKEEFLNDTLRISSIGYKSIRLLVKDLIGNKEPAIIQLDEEIGQLDEVIISTKVIKTKTLGNKTESKFLSTGFSYDQLGAEMGIKINIRNKPTYVDAFNFHISYNRLSTQSIFRLNFYSIKNSKPFENILKENIFVPIQPEQTGLVTVDLKLYDIILNDDVIVTLEWIDSKGENNKGEAIFFSLGLLTNGTLYKSSSQANFKKHSSLGVGFNLDVKY